MIYSIRKSSQRDVIYSKQLLDRHLCNAKRRIDSCFTTIIIEFDMTVALRNFPMVWKVLF